MTAREQWNHQAVAAAGPDHGILKLGDATLTTQIRLELEYVQQLTEAAAAADRSVRTYNY